MERIAGIAVALATAAAGCGTSVKQPPGPLDRYYMPTGVAVQRFGPGPADARLLVVSSNADLQYDIVTGGSVIALEGDLATTTYGRSGAVNVESFGGDLAIARPSVPGIADDPMTCDSTAVPLAVFATRGSNTLNLVEIDEPSGRLGCASCSIPLAGPFADPLPVVVACKTGQRASVFVGYLRTVNADAWVTEYRLGEGMGRSMNLGPGPVRGLAYDASRDRLYVVGLATGAPTPLRYVDLAGCTFGAPTNQGGCAVGTAQLSDLSGGPIELRSMALAHEVGHPQRAFLTGRVYDGSSAATAGGRTSDLGGKLLVVDLVDGPAGLVVNLVGDPVDIGHGAQDVRVLPRDPAWPASRGDIVAALSVDGGYLWIFDTQTKSTKTFGHDPLTGLPVAGSRPYGLAVDPLPINGAARVYVGSYSASHVTPIDVPLAVPDPVEVATYAGGHQILLTGAGAVP